MTRAELAVWLAQKAEVLEGQAQTARSFAPHGSTAGQVQAAEAERYREAARLLLGDVPTYVGAQCQCMDAEGSSGPDEFCRHCFGSGVPGGKQ